MRVLADKKDSAAINGHATEGQLLGILNTPGVKTVRFSGPATLSKLQEFEREVAGKNVDPASFAYLVSPVVQRRWHEIKTVEDMDVFLWPKGSSLLNGHPSRAMDQVPDDKVIFADWNNLILADWAGIDLVVDPQSLKKSEQYEVTVAQWVDIRIRNPKGICISSDSGMQ
jgi:hypothetical protein